MVAGCGADIAGTNPVDEVENLAQAGRVTVSIAPPEVAARALSDRFVFDDVLVQFRRASDDAVARQAVLTLANPSVTFKGLPGGFVGYAYAAVRRDGVVFTDGQSSPVTIVAGKTVKAAIKIAATTAEARMVAPATSGATVTTPTPGIILNVCDPGGKPVSAHLYRVSASGAILKDLGVRTGTNEDLSWGDSGLGDGEHHYRLETATASGGNGEFSFSLVVDTSGGLNIEISSQGRG
ncbi:MAG: hypothetical protein ACOX0G_03535 [Patescibacteria group bacterium]